MENRVLRTSEDIFEEVKKLGRFINVYINRELDKEIDFMELKDQQKIFRIKLFLCLNEIREAEKYNNTIRIITAKGDLVEFKSQNKKYLNKQEILEELKKLLLKGGLKIIKKVDDLESEIWKEEVSIEIQDAISAVQDAFPIFEEKWVFKIEDDSITYYNLYMAAEHCICLDNKVKVIKIS